MISYSDIRDVHLEISSRCNASCPLCPRNFNGYPHNDGYPELSMTLENAKHIFNPEFISQLTTLRINGNYGDIVMNHEAVDIIKYFRVSNSNLKISISTNGSARNKIFWSSLAKLNVEVSFCLDGLEDTHSLYRQNTSWNTVIKNAVTFINSGGHATWKFIQFDHNIHQIDQCKALSHQLKFKHFQLVDHGRNLGPVFDKNGKHTHNIGNYQGLTEFPILFNKKKTDLVLLEDIIPGKIPKNTINCKTKLKKSIYIAANGEVYPCCWTGFYPRTFGHGQYHQAVNAQLKPLMKPNNAIERPLEECIIWFDSIQNLWNAKTYEHGRLVVCDDACGSD